VREIYARVSRVVEDDCVGWRVWHAKPLRTSGQSRDMRCSLMRPERTAARRDLLEGCAFLYNGSCTLCGCLKSLRSSPVKAPKPSA
jgi:hypothetical protein